MLKADGGALPLTWLVDGAPITSDPHAREATGSRQDRGFAKLTVIDANGQVDRVSVRSVKYSGAFGSMTMPCGT